MSEDAEPFASWKAVVISMHPFVVRAGGSCCIPSRRYEPLVLWLVESYETQSVEAIGKSGESPGKGASRGMVRPVFHELFERPAYNLPRGLMDRNPLKVSSRSTRDTDIGIYRGATAAERKKTNDGDTSWPGARVVVEKKEEDEDDNDRE